MAKVQKSTDSSSLAEVVDRILDSPNSRLGVIASVPIVTRPYLQEDAPRCHIVLSLVG